MFDTISDDDSIPRWAHKAMIDVSLMIESKLYTFENIRVMQNLMGVHIGNLVDHLYLTIWMFVSDHVEVSKDILKIRDQLTQWTKSPMIEVARLVPGSSSPEVVCPYFVADQDLLALQVSSDLTSAKLLNQGVEVTTLHASEKYTFSLRSREGITAI